MVFESEDMLYKRFVGRLCREVVGKEKRIWRVNGGVECWGVEVQISGTSQPLSGYQHVSFSGSLRAFWDGSECLFTLMQSLKLGDRVCIQRFLFSSYIYTQREIK